MADTFNYGLSLNRSHDLEKFDSGEGTLGVGERLFDLQYGTRTNSNHGMFSELFCFSSIVICARNADLALYPNGTKSVSSGLVGSVRIPSWGSAVMSNVHLQKGSVFLTNPGSGVGTYVWFGAGW